MTSSKCSRRHPESGSIVIEFALSAFLILGFFIGIFQFGYMFYAYNVLVNAVRDGARYASLKPYDSASATPSSDFLTAVQNQVVYGNSNPGNGATPILNGLTTDNVSLVVTPGPAGLAMTPPASMTVSITNFTINSMFSSAALNGRPSSTFPYTGTVVAPPPGN